MASGKFKWPMRVNMWSLDGKNFTFVATEHPVRSDTITEVDIWNGDRKITYPLPAPLRINGGMEFTIYGTLPINGEYTDEEQRSRSLCNYVFDAGRIDGIQYHGVVLEFERTLVT